MAKPIADVRLEHFYQGKLYQDGVPAGDFRVTRWSPGLTEGDAEVLFGRVSVGSYNNVASVEALRHGYALIDLPPNRLLLLHGVRSPLRSRGHFYPEYHVVVLPRPVWEQTLGNLGGLVDLLAAEEQMPAFSAPGPILPLIEWTPPAPLTDAERDARARPFIGSAMCNTILSAVTKWRTVSVLHAPGSAERLRLVQAVLTLLPRAERSALTFATEVFDPTTCAAQLKFLFADPLLQPSPTDVVVRWRVGPAAPLAETSDYVRYLNEDWDNRPSGVIGALDELDRAAANFSDSTVAPEEVLDVLAVRLHPRPPRQPEKWFASIGLYGSPQEFRAELAKPELQRQWPDSLRAVARYLTEPAAPRPPAGELARAATAAAPTRPKFLLPLAQTAVDVRRLELFDKETLDTLGGLSHRDEWTRSKVINILSGARHAEWVEALESWAVWDLLNLWLELGEPAGAAELLRAMHKKWKGSPTWAADLQAFWFQLAALNTPDDARRFALQVRSTADLPSYVTFDLLVSALKRHNWNAPELVSALGQVYAQEPLPADRTEAILDLIVGLLPQYGDPAVGQVMLKALKRLFDKPEAAELTQRLQALAQRLGRTPYRAALYEGIMHTARAMDVRTLEAFYRLLPRDSSLARESASIRAILVAAGRIRPRGPLEFIQKGLLRRRRSK